MATASTSRGRRFDTEETLNMLMDSDNDESDNEIGEPMCPGSDEEFPDPDDELLFRYVNKLGKNHISVIIIIEHSL